MPHKARPRAAVVLFNELRRLLFCPCVSPSSMVYGALTKRSHISSCFRRSTASINYTSGGLSSGGMDSLGSRTQHILPIPSIRHISFLTRYRTVPRLAFILSLRSHLSFMFALGIFSRVSVPCYPCPMINRTTLFGVA